MLPVCRRANSEIGAREKVVVASALVNIRRQKPIPVKVPRSRHAAAFGNMARVEAECDAGREQHAQVGAFQRI